MKNSICIVQLHSRPFKCKYSRILQSRFGAKFDNVTAGIGGSIQPQGCWSSGIISLEPCVIVNPYLEVGWPYLHTGIGQRQLSEDLEYQLPSLPARQTLQN